jgi:riboflavin kinase/FMN adenylyltransferase
MEVVNIKKLRNLEEKFAMAIGFFDGIHLGHQKVINNAVDYANENHVKSIVITFDRSPKVALGYAMDEGYLTPTDEKLRLLEEMGVDYTLVLKFNDSLLSLSADAFINEYLLEIGTCYVSVGFDFRFGQGGTGDTERLQRCGAFKVDVSEPVLMAGAKVSTRSIKKYLKMGDLDIVTQMLGRHFSVSGEVVYGQQLGRTIGFPTVNLKLDGDYLFSLRGVYATVSYIDGIRHVSMTNVGYNPTMNLVDDISIETHIFNFDQEIYGKKIRVEFIGKIRDEITFNGIDKLIAQLEKDKLAVKSMSI